MCIHSKCNGSTEFSWHCSQLQGTSAKTICTKPFFQMKGSQLGTRGAGWGPRYAQIRPPRVSTGYAGDANLVLEACFGLRDVFVGLFQAAAIAIEKPSVIIAAQAGLFDEAVGHVRAAMRAVAADEAEVAGHIFIEGEIFTEQADGLDGLRFEFADRGDGHPVAAEEIAHLS